MNTNYLLELVGGTCYYIEEPAYKRIDAECSSAGTMDKWMTVKHKHGTVKFWITNIQTLSVENASE